jgi:hypothetical protein
MSKIIEIAEKEIGYTESPKNSNRTKYGEWFGLDGVAWCGIFVSWCYAKAGTPLPPIGFLKGFAGCQTLYQHAKAHDWIIPEEQAQAGDIVLFDFHCDDRFDHVGLFVSMIKGDEFETIEGNTAIYNDSNGGAVMRRQRGIYDFPVFIHPKTLKI